MWFLRAIELSDGGWACRYGLTEFDTHPQLDHAVDHLRELAEELGPAQLFVHRLNGNVVQLP